MPASLTDTDHDAIICPDCGGTVIGRLRRQKPYPWNLITVDTGVGKQLACDRQGLSVGKPLSISSYLPKSVGHAHNAPGMTFVVWGG